MRGSFGIDGRFTSRDHQYRTWLALNEFFKDQGPDPPDPGPDPPSPAIVSDCFFQDAEWWASERLDPYLVDMEMDPSLGMRVAWRLPVNICLTLHSFPQQGFHCATGLDVYRSGKRIAHYRAGIEVGSESAGVLESVAYDPVGKRYYYFYADGTKNMGSFNWTDSLEDGDEVFFFSAAFANDNHSNRWVTGFSTWWPIDSA